MRWADFQRERTETHLIRRHTKIRNGKSAKRASKHGREAEFRKIPEAKSRRGIIYPARSRLSAERAIYCERAHNAASKDYNNGYFEDYENGGLIQWQLPRLLINRADDNSAGMKPLQMKRNRTLALHKPKYKDRFTICIISAQTKIFIYKLT